VPVSESFKQMIRSLLNKNPDERPSIKQARQDLEWLKRPEFESEKPQPIPGQNNAAAEEEKTD